MPYRPRLWVATPVTIIPSTFKDFRSFRITSSESLSLTKKFSTQSSAKGLSLLSSLQSPFLLQVTILCGFLRNNLLKSLAIFGAFKELRPRGSSL